MPEWVILAAVAAMALGVVGFFALVFAEMRAKRKTGRSTASRGSRGRGKTRQRKSR